MRERQPLLVRFARWAERVDDRHNPDINTRHPAWWLFVIAERLREHGPCRHHVINDQCCKPEHRLCAWCDRAMPNRPVDDR